MRDPRVRFYLTGRVRQFADPARIVYKNTAQPRDMFDGHEDVLQEMCDLGLVVIIPEMDAVLGTHSGQWLHQQVYN